MDKVRCAVGVGKRGGFGWERGRRRALGGGSHALLQAGPGVGLRAVRDDRDCVWAQYTVFVDERDRVQKALQARGIPTAVHYPRPLHLQPAYASLCCSDCCPASVRASQRVMSLPMSADLTEAQQDEVVAALREAVAAVATPEVA